MIYSDIIQSFEEAGYRLERIENEHGCLACLPAAARIIAFAPDTESESFLYNPLAILNADLLQKDLYLADGAPGGDRLWIAPENPYFCEIELAEYVDHSRYFRPQQIDPGNYSMERRGNAVQFGANIKVLNNRNNDYSRMRVDRMITQLASPIAASDVSCASYRIDQQLDVNTGLAGLWNIAQVPTGGVIVMPLREQREPTNYFNSATYELSKNACAFYVNGKSHTKIGYGWDVATGNSAVFSWQGEELSMLYRQFPIIENGYYCDLPFVDAPPDQVLQVWDGLGFGEMEYHSIAAGDLSGQKTVSDSSWLHGLRGSQEKIIEVGSEMLGIPLKELSIIVAKLV